MMLQDLKMCFPVSKVVSRSDNKSATHKKTVLERTLQAHPLTITCFFFILIKLLLPRLLINVSIEKMDNCI